jgi:hypothetical protein
MSSLESLAGVLHTLREPRVVRGITVHHSDGPPMAQPETLDGWHRDRGFAVDVTAADYAPDHAPLWLHLRPGEVRTLHAGYHVYVTADGAIWRCRPESKHGAHCRVANRNETHLSVCLAGKLEECKPAASQLDALRHVLVGWCTRYSLDPDLAIEGHRDAPGAATDCPGRFLYTLLPTLRREVAALLTGHD